MKSRSFIYPRLISARRKLRLESGHTLIEILLVIGIFSMILLGSISIYTTVVRQKDIMVTAADVTFIRNAVTRWSVSEGRGGAILGHGDTLDWEQLAPYLPRRLKDLAEMDSDAVLDHANPWDGTYALKTVAAENYKWVLEIGDIPTNLREFLSQQLLQFDPSIDLAPGNCSAGEYCIGVDQE